MKTKEELEQAIVMLEERVVSNTSEMISVQADLKDAEKQLANINKPELTGSQLDDISEAVENAVGHFDFEDIDNYDKEFEIDYDGRVQLSSFDFINSQELVEAIVEKLHKLFIEIEDEDND
jgi:hypothetical protein